MRRATAVVSVTIVLLVGSLYAFAPGRRRAVAGEFAPGVLVVKLRAGDGSALRQMRSLRRLFPGSSAVRIFGHLPSPGEGRKTPSPRASRAGKDRPAPTLDGIYRVALADRRTDVEAFARRIARDPEVVYAEPDFLYRTSAPVIPNDPYFSSAGSWGQPYDDLWGLKRIQAPQAWLYATGSGVLVAVIDSGVDYNHADIRSNVWINPGEDLNHNGSVDAKDVNGLDDDGNGFIDDLRGWDFINGDRDPIDDFGHGTHVAGIVAAIGNNQRGVIGVAYGSKILALKSLGSAGTGSSSAASAAIVYAADAGADVINMSWGGLGSQLLSDAIAYAASAGCLMVAAAGNGNTDVGYSAPARYKDVIAVAATDHTDVKSDFSNWGTKISVAAPGGDSADPSDAPATYRNILSLRSAKGALIDQYPAQIVGRDYFRLRGTSMAAPHAAGVLALALSRQPALTVDLARAVLEGSADDLGPPGFDVETGYGRLDAGEAVLRADLATIRPELTVDRILLGNGSAAPDGPLEVGVEVGNLGMGPASTISVEIFDGDPAASGLLVGRRMLADLPPGKNSVVPFTVALDGYGLHVLHAVVDRLDGVAEINELNNSSRTTVQVSTFASTQVPVATIPGSDQTLPSAGDTGIVWQDFRGGDADVYLHDPATGQERRLTTDPSDQLLPSISGNVVVWQDDRNGNWDIYAHDAASGVETRITSDPADQTFPSIDGGRIVWADSRNGNSDIYLFDLSTGEERRITTDPADQTDPVISGDRIVWVDDRNGNPDVYLHDLTIGEERAICTDPAVQYAAAIDGDHVVWVDTSGGISRIRILDIVTGQETAVPAGEGGQFFPSISGDLVAYEDDRSGASQIYLTSLATGQDRAITSGGFRHYYPSVSASGVAWQDDRDGTWDIYLERWDPFPRPPSSLRGIASAGVVSLEWDPSLESDVASYSVYRSTDPAEGWDLLGSTALTAWIEGSAIAGVPYRYRVAAMDTGGNRGGFSNEISATP